MSKIEKLERERAALAKKIAAERARLAGKIGADLIKAIGEERAERLVAALANMAKRDGALAALAAVDELHETGSASERRNGAGEPAAKGAAAS